MNFSRQLGILNPSEEIIFPVTIIGLGGIGSFTSRCLAKMGFREMIIYDPDIVEEHNQPNQDFRKKDIGRLKTEAIKEIIEDCAQWCKITAIPEDFGGQRELSGIVISAVDHMEVNGQGFWGRKEIWQNAVCWNPNVVLYIDGRLGGELIDIHTIRPNQLADIEIYEKTLYPEKEASRLACTEQSIIYVGYIIAGLIALQVKKWLKNEEFDKRIMFGLRTLDLLLNGKPADTP